MEYVIDFEALTSPISEDSPCGSDLREDMSFDSPYQGLKDAREEAMTVEREDRSTQSEEAGQGFTTDVGKWKRVVEAASEILKDSSKDLEVCALLIEGLARTHGPAGLRDGWLVTAHLVNNHWEELFPRLDPSDEDSLEDRVAGFTGLNGTGQPGPLARYIGLMEVTQGAGGGDFRCHHYNRAAVAARNPDPDAREQQFSAMGYSLELIEKAAAETSTSFFVEMAEALAGSREALQQLDQAFVDTCGYGDAPPSSMIAEGLESLADAIAYLGKDKLADYAARLDAEAGQAEDSEGDEPAEGGSAKASGPGQGSGAIASREDAISRLRLIATYFRDTEPHSPLSYSLQNLIRWSQLPLDRLLEEWIQDPDARQRYMLMTGISPNNADQDPEE